MAPDEPVVTGTAVVTTVVGLTTVDKVEGWVEAVVGAGATDATDVTPEEPVSPVGH